jgi:hypothetical protein
MAEQTGTRAPIGAVLAIAGGALMAAGSFLSWAQVSGGGTSASAKGIDGTDGYITLVAGIVALAVGLMMMKQGKRVLAILAILAGLVGGGVGVYDALTAKDSVLESAAEEIAPSAGVSVEEARAFLDAAVDAGQISISISLGLYVVIGGGLLALVGGFLSIGASGEASGGQGSGSASGFAAPEPAMPATPTAPAMPSSPAPPAAQAPDPPQPPEGSSPG